MSTSKSKQKRAKPARDAEADVEAGAEEIMEEIDQHALSQTEVPKQVSLDFWSAIIASLRIRIHALKGGDED